MDHMDVRLSASAFAKISAIAEEEAGLNLPVSKHTMVAARLGRRLSRLALRDYDEYLMLISDPASRERRRMVAALTTNVSKFFREAHHFDYLRQSVLPGLVAEARSGGRVRIWSAGCANGQEAVSIAISLQETCPEAHQLDIRILGTDIDPAVIRFAELATYHRSMMSGLSDERINRFFQADISAQSYRVRPEVARMLIFRELNLHGHWPMPGRFDVILCRNVVIYFGQSHQDQLWARFHGKLRRHGLLFIGHSERVPARCGFALDAACHTLYRRRELSG